MSSQDEGAEARRPEIAGNPVRGVGPNGTPIWYISRNADVHDVLACRFASSDPSRPGFPEPEDLQARTPFLIELDAPRHAQLRRLVLPEFGTRPVKLLEPLLQASAEQLIADMCASGPKADLREAFAKPLASLAICHLLAVPAADGPLLSGFAETLANDGDVEAQGEALAAVTAYMEQFVSGRIARPSTDLFGRLAGGALKEGQITREELVALSILLLMAGHDTNAKMILLGVGTLLDHPAARERVINDPTAAYAAVDELIRLHSIANDDGFRVATADIDVGGIVIPAGEGIVPLSRQANHDPAVFCNPSDFDIDRNTNRHLGFGFGPHLCLGRQLARATQVIAYRSLFGSIRELRRADGEKLIVTGWVLTK